MSRQWQIFVNGIERKTYTLHFTTPLEELYVKDVKEKVKEIIGIPLDEQRLICSGKQLEEEKRLTDYPKLSPGSTLFLVLRLARGTTAFSEGETATLSGLLESESPCMICFYHPKEDLRNGEPCLEDRMTLLMPHKGLCHTSLHHHCLMLYAHNEVYNNKKVTICCPWCKSKWTLEVMVATKKLKQQTNLLSDETMSINAIRSDPNIRECPGCTSFCERKNESDICVQCRVCAKKGEKSDFCWYCLKHWTGSSTTKCSNPECNSSEILAQIQATPEKQFFGIKNLSDCLCPNCGASIERSGSFKRITCSKCHCEFCFLCLLQRGSSWLCGSYNIPDPHIL